MRNINDIPNGYRQLKDGEIIKLTDKRWSLKFGEWVVRTKGNEYIGATYNQRIHSKTIRRINEQRSETDLKLARWE